MSFFDYFHDHIDYPDMLYGAPLGVLCQYVPSSYLSGVINYTDVKMGYVVHRYRGAANPSNIHSVYSEEDYQKEIDESLSEATYLNLPKITDDVFLLCKPQKAPKNFKKCDLCFCADSESKLEDLWVFFWFDQDSSDCCFGIFETEDSIEEISKNLESYIIEEFKKFTKFPELSKVRWVVG